MAKLIVNGKESRIAICRGVNQLADAVKATLGPRGRNVVIERRFGPPMITKDGVTVAREIELPDALDNIGAQMVREVALRMSDVAGDGTTTATVLAQSIYVAGMALLDSGKVNPMALKRGIDLAVSAVVGKAIRAESGFTHQGGSLDTLRRDADRDLLECIGAVSSNGDKEVGRIITEAMEKVGSEGVVTVEESRLLETELTVVEGMQFSRGYLSPYFVNEPNKMESVLNNPLVFVTNRTLGNTREFAKVMEKAAHRSRPLFVIAPKVEVPVIQLFLDNILRHRSITGCVISAPGFGPQQDETLRDICALTGATFIAEGMSPDRLYDVEPEHFGEAKTVVVSANSTTIVVPEDDEIKAAIGARADHIRAMLKSVTTDFERGKLQERLAKLTAGVAVIHVGAPTELEMKEKKDRVEDAAHAMRAAEQEGVVPGGGIALFRCIPDVEKLADSLAADERAGAELIVMALEMPLRQIIANAGEDEEKILDALDSTPSPQHGWDCATGDYVDMFERGIVDPIKVTRNALINASSIAGMMLTTEALISDIPPAPGSLPAMPGMM